MEELIGLFLEAEEFEENINIILDSNVAYELAKILKDDLEKKFYSEAEEKDYDKEIERDFKDLLINNDILSVAVMYENGHPLYFLQEAMYEEITAECDADMFYVQDNLLDVLDINRLNGDIVKFELEYKDEYNEEEVDEFEYMLEEQTDELLEKILEDKDCVHCLIKEALEDIYYRGYNDAIDKMQEKLYEL
ncbi:hypothetical protein DVV91_17285 [Clostridium botulinum]|uniref:hypothetical protein n=1 Tax=Clostridium botulinum TaxID=1491 RepID=UPI0019671A94|nr:hypothetical protein [Clostridium botulinum]MBN1076076.1 hypothetical protein [Clostridium botulinum]